MLRVLVWIDKIRIIKVHGSLIMKLKEILNIIITIAITLSSILQILPVFASDETEVQEILPPPLLGDVDEADVYEVIDTDGEPSVSETFFLVTFDLHGGIVTLDFATQAVRGTTTATRPPTNPTKEGYYFIGWFTSGTGGNEFNFNAAITSHLTIHAQWKQLPIEPPIRHIVTLDFNGGTAVAGVHRVPVIVQHEQRMQDPHRGLGINVRRANHDLTGWSMTRDNHVGNFDFNNTPITQDIVLYAQWEPRLIQTPPPPPPPPPRPPNRVPPQNPAPPPIIDPPPLITVGPPGSSGISMEVNDDGVIVITGPQTGAGEIKIANAPAGVEFARVGAFNEIFILFPEGTDTDTIDVTTPTDEWTYDFFDDVQNNVVLALLPPGVDLATVLNDPLNPQPRDRSLLNLPDDEPPLEPNLPEEPPVEEQNPNPSNLGATDNNPQPKEEAPPMLPEAGALPNVLISLGLATLGLGCLLSGLKLKIDGIGG